MADWLQPGSISYELFISPKLDTWANVSEFIGVAFAGVSIVVSLLLKKEVTHLKRELTFDRRVASHIKKLREIANNLNQLLNSYSQNTDSIRTEIGICETELTDLAWKLSSPQRRKSKNLASFIRRIKTNQFSVEEIKFNPFIDLVTKYSRRFFLTNVSDIWHIHDTVNEIINQLENIRQNRRNSM